MNIKPISNSNQIFYRKGSFRKGVKKFCENIFDRMARSANRVAETKTSIITPFNKNVAGRH